MKSINGQRNAMARILIRKSISFMGTSFWPRGTADLGGGELFDLGGKKAIHR